MVLRPLTTATFPELPIPTSAVLHQNNMKTHSPNGEIVTETNRGLVEEESSVPGIQKPHTFPDNS